MTKNNNIITTNNIKTNFKTFDMFIAYHFHGLSAHTLYQMLCAKFPELSPQQQMQNSVYVVLYRIYTRSSVTTEDINTFFSLRAIFLQTEGLTGDISEEDILQIISEEAYCLRFGYEAVNLHWLKDNAFDWYIYHVISLRTFRRIAAL